MSEQPEPSERTTNEPREQLTFAEAGERLNISPDAVRMRVHRGKLASVRVNDRTFVLWPQPEQVHEPNVERMRSERRSDVQGDERLVAALEDRIASLERQLDYQTRFAAELVKRLPELPAGDMPQEAHTWPVRDVRPAKPPDSLIHRVRRLIGR